MATDSTPTDPTGTPEDDTGKFLDDVSDDLLEDLCAAIKDGAENVGDALGFGPGALNSIEEMALSNYRSCRYDDAAKIYAFILRMNPRRSTTWRGLGACAQASKLFKMAAFSYDVALQCDPADVISKVVRGECLCSLGDKEQGLAL